MRRPRQKQNNTLRQPKAGFLKDGDLRDVAALRRQMSCTDAIEMGTAEYVSKLWSIQPKASMPVLSFFCCVKYVAALRRQMSRTDAIGMGTAGRTKNNCSVGRETQPPWGS